MIINKSFGDDNVYKYARKEAMRAYMEGTPFTKEELIAHVGEHFERQHEERMKERNQPKSLIMNKYIPSGYMRRKMTQLKKD